MAKFRKHHNRLLICDKVTTRMRYCKKCLYPDTKPKINFDKDGICSACNNVEYKNKIDWSSRKKELVEILEKYKSKDGSRYDCIIPVSGGKDSHYQTHVIKNEFGLNPLCVNFHPHDFTETGRKNIENLKQIGVDCIEFSSNPLIYNKLSKFGLTELGDFEWPEHLGIFTIPIQIAVKYKIPLIIWGENTAMEYGGPQSATDEKFLDRDYQNKHGDFFQNKITAKDMVNHGFELKDLQPYLFPDSREIAQLGLKELWLGSFIKWDIFKQLEIVKNLGFSSHNEIKEGTYDSWENLDTKFTVFHDYFKWLKFGFGRATDHVSIEIRYGRMTRQEGLKLVKQFEGKIPTKYLDEFLQDAELTFEEFIKICEKFTDKDLFKKDSNGNLIRDNEGNITKIKYDND